MQCASDSIVFPYMSYTCTEDFVSYDDNGAINGEGSANIDGIDGYAAVVSVDIHHL